MNEHKKDGSLKTTKGASLPLKMFGKCFLSINDIINKVKTQAIDCE